MTHDEALKLLSLDKAACALTPEIITAAYRRALVAEHPDTGGASDVLPGQLQQARRIVTDALDGVKTPCPQCKGRGKVPGKMGTTPCGACKGSGEAP